MNTASKLKVLTVIGTRPEIIRLSEVIKELDRSMEHVLVHTGQNYDYELSQVFFDDLGIRKPNYFLSAAGKTPAETVGNVIAKVDEVLAKEAPDAVLILGDTNSCFAAYPAKRRKIPIFHMEAGNRSSDQRVPEEINRKVVDHISDINMPYSERAREYLIREGIPPERVIKTGSPMMEVLNAHKDAFEHSEILKKLGLKKGGYYVMSFHREENVTDQGHLDAILDAVDALAKEGLPIIISTHPRTSERVEATGRKFPESVRFMKPLGLFDFVHLEQHAACVISDSGTISEESSILGFPAVNMREAHERMEAMDEAAVIMSGLQTDRILESIALARDAAREGTRFGLAADYSVPNVSKKVIRIIQSYTDYVNRRVWMKHG